MRKRIYMTVHDFHRGASARVYRFIMMVAILASIIPTTSKVQTPAFYYIDCTCLCIFALDFLLRWFTADYKFKIHHWTSFVRYPIRAISVIDLLSIFALVTSVFHLFEGSDITKALTVFRIIRICRYSKNVRFILDILKKSKKPLAAVGALALGYIAVSAIIMFNVEPQSFDTFFDAVYWSTVSLTTVGYGDIYPVTVIGRAVAMISSFFGIAVVALPAGIVTAEYLAVLKDDMKEE